MKNNIIKIAVAICTLLLTSSLLYAQNVFYNVPIQNQNIIGNALNPTMANPIVYATQFVAADKTGLTAIPAANAVAWRSNIAAFKYKKSAGRLMLTLNDHDLGYVPQSFTYSVNVEIRYVRYNPDHDPNTSEYNNPTTNKIESFSTTLSINYDKTTGKVYTEKAFYNLEDVHALEVKVLGVSDANLSKYAAINLEIEQERYSTLSAAQVALTPNFTGVTPIEHLTGQNQIKFSFNPAPVLPFATEYDVEWTLIENYNANGTIPVLPAEGTYTNNHFRFNATRVTVTSTSYTIPNVFGGGHLIFRVRAAALCLNANDAPQRVECAWSAIKAIKIDKFDASSGPKEHEAKLNWQYQCTFAEEGKQSNAITYYDGTLRARQAVGETLNTLGEKIAVVQDKIYDYQGRPAIEVLPVPLTVAELKYYPDLTLKDIATPTPYSKADFDTDAGVNEKCSTTTAPMKITAGAAQYYSTNNTTKSTVETNFQNYVPVADGFPFVQTVYTPDNTGRIAAQTAPGITHKLGSGRETEYSYLTPNQDELDRLFGSEAGYHEHYQKVAVKDANGQYSVSYKNADGKVVATALAGIAPTQLDTLPSHKRSSYNQTADNFFTVDLMDKGDAVYTEKGLVSSYFFKVTEEADYKFYYSVIPQQYNNAQCVTLPYCSDCVYDLEISLKNSCDIEQLRYNNVVNNPLKRTIGHKPTESTYQSCQNPTSYSLAEDFSGTEAGYITVRLTPGDYNITKKLAVNEEALNYYADKYIADLTGVGIACKSLAEFEQEALEAIDYSGCNITCEQCLGNLGLTKGYNQEQLDVAKQNYVSMRRSELVELGRTPTEEDDDASRAGFNHYLNNCEEICDETPANFCESIKEILKADMRPGGQYAKYKVENGYYVADDHMGGDKLNILSDYDEATSLHMSYKNATDYATFANTTVSNAGQTIASLTVQEFVSNFKEEWLDHLVTRHPEYCQYQKCINEQESEDYNNKMLAAQTYAEAIASGADNLTNPVREENGIKVSSDPLFKPTHCGENAINDMWQRMNENYLSVPEYITYRFVNGQGKPTSIYHNDDVLVFEVLDIPNEQILLKDKLNPSKTVGYIDKSPMSLATVAEHGDVVKRYVGGNIYTIGSFAKTLLQDGTYLKRIVKDNGIPYQYKVTDIAISQLYCSQFRTDQSKKMEDCVKKSRINITTPARTCDDFQNRYWETYRALYLSNKRYLQTQFAEANTCNCPAFTPQTAQGGNLVYAREKRFNPTGPDGTEMFKNSNGSNIDPRQTITLQALENSVTNTHTNMQEQYAANCEGYREYWKSRLSACSTATALLTESEMDALLDDMVDVCKRGSDVNNPMGSSTASPANWNVQASGGPAVINTLHDVLVNRGYYELGVCDELLIHVPKPYGHDYFATESPYADTCSCNQQQYGYFTNQGVTCPLVTPVPAENCPCKSNKKLSQTVRTTLLIGKGVDESKKCKKCLGCLELKPALEAFDDKYPSLLESDENFNALFTNFMNNRLNMNLELADYMGLIKECSSVGTLKGYLEYYDGIELTSIDLPLNYPTIELWPTQPMPQMLASTKHDELGNSNNSLQITAKKEASKLWQPAFTVARYMPLLKITESQATASLQPIIQVGKNEQMQRFAQAIGQTNHQSATVFAPPHIQEVQTATNNPDKCGCNKIFDLWKSNPDADDEELAQLFADAHNSEEPLPNFKELKKLCCKSYKGISVGLPSGGGNEEDPYDFDPDETPDPNPTEPTDLEDDDNCLMDFGDNPGDWQASWGDNALLVLQANLMSQKLKFPEALRCPKDNVGPVDECGCDELIQFEKDYFGAYTTQAQQQANPFYPYILARKGLTVNIDDLDKILALCKRIKTKHNTATDPDEHWNVASAQELADEVAAMQLKLPNVFSCPPPPVMPCCGTGGGTGSGSGNCVVYDTMSCMGLRAIINAAFTNPPNNQDVFFNHFRMQILRGKSEWATILNTFKTRIGFANLQPGCRLAINFTQNSSRCGAAQPEQTLFHLFQSATDNQISDLIQKMMVEACGCGKINTSNWTRNPILAVVPCSTCYGPSKTLHYLQKFLTELAGQNEKVENVSSPNYMSGINYRFNRFYNEDVDGYDIQNTTYGTEIYDGNNNSSLVFKKVKGIPYMENFYRMEITDGHDYSKFLTLNFKTKHRNNKFYFVVRFFNIRPVCPDPESNFEAEVELQVYDPTRAGTGLPVTEIRTIQGNISGLPALGVPFNCCAKVCNKPANRINGLTIDPCDLELRNAALFAAQINYKQYVQEKLASFRAAYMQRCLLAAGTEQFTMKYNNGEYHYTLYYYDQAGNLVKTVPPAGVRYLTQAQIDDTQTKRAANNPADAPVLPSHELITQYRYNTLNQLIWQSTPDAGVSEFYYDKLGRIIFSRNAQQAATSGNVYSYTKYDALGRITEVGKVNSNTYSMNHTKSRNQTDIDLLLNAQQNVLTEITKTYYDNPTNDVTAAASFPQDNLRTRVSRTTYQTIASTAITNPILHEVLYTYDLHGNVKRLARQINNLNNNSLNEGLKIIEYGYDLVSGKVNHVIYQKGKADQFIHQYQYDALNRLVNVRTGQLPELLETDAGYQYYNHGPLARTELGKQLVQGVDYAYTIQGWLKAVNSSTLRNNRDMGKDGFAGSNNDLLHKNVARDEFGFVLDYFVGDYQPVNNTTAFNSFVPNQTGSVFAAAKVSLYNGNIAAMTTAIGRFMLNGAAPLASVYKYDQLNRIKDARYYNNMDVNNNQWSSTGAVLTDYRNTFTYDANGNIVSQLRNGSQIEGVELDDLTYTYAAGTNKLIRVTDTKSDVAYADDINSQPANNYAYDAIGNLIQDKAEEIQNIVWSVYGKITKIQRTPGSTKPDLEFEYTPDGHRAVKIVTPKTGGYIHYTYYVRDAQGNVMATYTRKTHKIINYPSLTYSDVNTKLISQIGTTAFANFISKLHTEVVGNTTLNDAFKTAVYNAFKDNTTHLTARLKEMDVNKVLNSTDKTYLNWVLANMDARQLIETMMLNSDNMESESGGAYIKDVCDCNARQTHDLLRIIAGNATLTKALLNTICLYDAEKSTNYRDVFKTLYYGVKNCPLSGTEEELIEGKINPLSPTYVANIDELEAALNSTLDDEDCELIKDILVLMYQNAQSNSNTAMIEAFYQMLGSSPVYNAEAQVENICACSTAAFNMSDFVESNLFYDFMLGINRVNGGWYNSLCADMGISTNPADLASVLSGANFSNTVSLLSGMGITGCSPDFKNILAHVYLNNPQAYADIMASTYFSATYGQGCITNTQNAFTCPEFSNSSTPLTDYFSPEAIWDKLLTLENNTYFANWYANNALAHFYSVAAKYEVSAVNTAQDAQPAGLNTTGMYGPGKGMEQYFNHIKTYLSTTVYDYMVSHFMGVSTTYMDSIKLQEWVLYGSSRVGTQEANLTVAGIRFTDAAFGTQNSSPQYFANNIYRPNVTALNTRPTLSRGNKRYELSNHLGNVLAVVSDKKLPVYVSNVLSHFVADVVSATDYSPFGAPLPGRTYQQGKFDAVVLNQKSGNWNLDATTGWQKQVWVSGNPTPNNTTITLTEEGGKLKFTGTTMYGQAYYRFNTVPGRVYRVKYRLSGKTMHFVDVNIFSPIARVNPATTSYINTVDNDREMIFTATESITCFLMTKGWSPVVDEKSVYLDYVTITEVPSQINTISCANIQDALARMSYVGGNMNDQTAVKNFLNTAFSRNYTYSEYATVIAQCSSTAQPVNYVLAAAGAEAASVDAGYAFSFNGKEADDETYGEGNAIAFEARIYDSRLGRFLSIDPLVAKYPFWSPYCFAGNSPIALIDHLGMGPEDPPKHGQSREAGGCTEYWDEYQNNGTGSWVDYKPETASRETIKSLKDYLKLNAEFHKYGMTYDDCIKAGNNAVDIAQGRSKGTLNEKTKKWNSKMKIYELYVYLTGDYLMKNGLASEYKEVTVIVTKELDKFGKPIPASRISVQTNGSTAQTALSMTDGRDGNHVFFLGLCGGLHTMTLIVNITNGNPSFILADQVFKYTEGWFESTQLDTDMKLVKIIMSNFPKTGKYKNTNNQLWQISAP